MAYDYFITRVSDLKLESPQRLRIPDWVDEDEDSFKSIMRFGDLDQFAIFTKDEILGVTTENGENSTLRNLFEYL